MECGRNTHTHETNGTQLHTHRQSNQSPEEKRWVLRAEIKWYYGRYIYIFVIRCDVEWYVVWCGMSVAWMDYRVWSGAEWCGEEERMVWNGGVKLRCGVECHGVILNVLWYGYVRFSVQSSLLFLYYVVFSVMSVLYCLCVSRIQCTQCSVSVYSIGSVL